MGGVRVAAAALTLVATGWARVGTAPETVNNPAISPCE